jgi:S-adenosylmethionine hydrolase
MPEEVPLTGAGSSRHRPVVSLLTDFGGSEPFVGLVKARILGCCPDAAIVDLTHELPPFAIEAAAFWIGRAFGHFPVGSVHVCVVDPGVGTARRILLVEHAGQYFLAPDNGLLTDIADGEGATVRAVDLRILERWGLGPPSATFHGRDLFAPLAGRLADGSIGPEELGGPVQDWLRLDRRPVEISPSRIQGTILFEDRFGNLFSNIELVSPVNSTEWQVYAEGRAVPWVRTYGNGTPGSLVALENAFGVLEIACVHGSAALALGSGPGTQVELRRLEAPG